MASARRELQRLSNLAGELLDLSRLDAQVPLRSEPVELGEMARAVAAEFSLRGRERGVAVEVVAARRATPGRPATPTRWRGSSASSSTTRCATGPPGEPIRVLAAAGGRPSIEVADRGPRRACPRTASGSSSASTARPRTGTGGGFGLGLAIGRGLAERMGGSLTLVSADGEGARFVLVLPRRGRAGDGRAAPVSSAPA